MAHQPARQSRDGLSTRVVSAAILIPVALAVVCLGSPWFVLLVAAIAGGMAWEWCEILAGESTRSDSMLGLMIGAGAILATGALTPLAGVAISLAGASVLGYRRLPRRASTVWMVIGMLWILLPSVGFVWLRSQPRIGFGLIVWLLVMVWTVDTAAYICGRLVGGPRLAPRISPNKTWAGLIGGVVSAIVVGFLVTYVAGFHDRVTIALASGALAIVEQTGDMAESYAKRVFGVKDSGSIIPGHGGMLDRMDGMLAVAAVLTLARLTGWNWA